MNIQKNMTSSDYIKLEDELGALTYKPLNLVIERAEGVWLYDIEGNKYLDCTSAFSSVNLGHCHPELLEVFKNQAEKVTQVSRAFRNTQLPRLFDDLVKLTGKNNILPMNTGAEAVETAVKLARKWGYTVKGIELDKAEIIVCENNFHGRTTTVVSFSSNQSYKKYFGPLTPGFKIIPFGDIKALEEAITPNTCAFLTEPLQGEGGIRIAPEGYLRQAKKLCEENNILLMADEIQSGFGRTGKVFACEHDNVDPDVLIVGKSLSGGFYPVSAVLADKSIMGVFQPGEHGSTFAGNPLGCAVARKAIEVLQRDKLTEKSAEMGKYFIEKLKTIKSSRIKEIRGKGLFIGIELNEEARPHCEELLKQGILCKETQTNTIRMTPPLIITEEQVDFICDCLKKVLEKE